MALEQKEGRNAERTVSEQQKKKKLMEKLSIKEKRPGK